MYTRANLAAIRVKKDLAELSLQQFDYNCKQAITHLEFPDPKNLLSIKVTIRMTGGLYAPGVFEFHLDVPDKYPFHAPSVVCRTRVWHPSVDLHTGFVSLPVLGLDWRPVLSINVVVLALQLMFVEPSRDQACNQLAAAQMEDMTAFAQQVRYTFGGGYIYDVHFEPQQGARQLSPVRPPGGQLLGGLLVSGVSVKKRKRAARDEEPPCGDLESMCLSDEMEEWEQALASVGLSETSGDNTPKRGRFHDPVHHPPSATHCPVLANAHARAYPPLAVPYEGGSVCAGFGKQGFLGDLRQPLHVQVSPGQWL